MSSKLSRRALLTRTGATIGALSILGVEGAFGQMAAFQTPPTPEEVFRDPDIPVLGNPDGDVTIVEFFDYQCPYCKLVHPTLLDAVADDGNTRLIMKDWPVFGDPSLFASRLVLGSAGTPAYEAGLTALMETEGPLDQGRIEAAVGEVGLDPAAMMARYEARRESVEALIDRNGRQAIGLRIGGTPAFVIGQRVYGGVLDANAFRQILSEARTEAPL